MREIKFRAWDTCCEMMLSHADLVDDVIDGYPLIVSLLNHENWGHIKLSQYTGLKDKNGVEIYDGDILEIVSWHFSGKWRSEIKWDPNSVSFVVKNVVGDIGVFVTENFCTVIGNIYENPELLDVDDE